MRALHVILGLGAVGVTVAAAKLIADAVKPTASLPPSNGTQNGLLVNRGPVSNVNTAVPSQADLCRATPACWCWGDGWGTPECAGFDYSQTQSVDEKAGTETANSFLLL